MRHSHDHKEVSASLAQDIDEMQSANNDERAVYLVIKDWGEFEGRSWEVLNVFSTLDGAKQRVNEYVKEEYLESRQATYHTPYQIERWTIDGTGEEGHLYPHSIEYIAKDDSEIQEELQKRKALSEREHIIRKRAEQDRGLLEDRQDIDRQLLKGKFMESEYRKSIDELTERRRIIDSEFSERLEKCRTDDDKLKK